jgi:hypothetical protein
MSFAEARIREYLASTIAVGIAFTEVRFAGTRVGDVEIGIVAKDRRMTSDREVSEDEIEQQLAQEGLIRLPPDNRRRRSEFKPIDVAGKPVSEMIIEERR